MKYIVKNFDTKELITEFTSSEDLGCWLDSFVENCGLLDGTRILIYQEKNKDED